MSTVGQVVYDAKIDTAGLRRSASESERIVSDSAEMSGKSMTKMGIVAGVAMEAASRAFNMISNSVGSAVDRIDTMNRFPTVMQNLGYSAEDAKKQVERMAKELIGLPTALDSLTTFVNRVAPVSGSLQKATDTALAFNNAVLAGGGPTYRQADAIEQFSQMLSKGVPDMMAWRTLQEAMPATLSQVAKGLGIASGNTLELYEAIQNGAISFDDFTNKIIEMNTVGLPGFKSFAEQAKDATMGISTGVMNMQTAITRGLATIGTAIGAANISVGIASIGTAFETALKSVAGLITFVQANSDVFAPIAVSLGTMLGVMTAWVAVTKTAALVQGAWNIAMAANPIGLTIVLVAGLAAGIGYLMTQTESGRALLQNMGSTLMNTFNMVMSAIQPMVSFFQSYMLPTLIQIGSYVGGQLRQAWDSISASVRTLTPFLQVLGITLGVVVVGAVMLFIGVAAGLIAVIATVINGIVRFIGTMVSWAAGVVNGAQIAAGAFQSAANAIGAAFNGAMNVLRGSWSGIPGFFASIAGAVVGALASIPNTIGSIFRNAFSSATAPFAGLAGFFYGMVGQMASAGAAIVQGLVSGMSPGPVISHMKNIASSAVGSIKASLGIKSPSRVFMGIGDYMMQGLGVGIDKGSDSAISSALNASRDVTSAFGGGINSPTITGSGTGSGGVSKTTTIGNVYLANDVDVDRFIRRLDENQEAISTGLVPNRSYA